MDDNIHDDELITFENYQKNILFTKTSIEY